MSPEDKKVFKYHVAQIYAAKELKAAQEKIEAERRVAEGKIKLAEAIAKRNRKNAKRLMDIGRQSCK